MDEREHLYAFHEYAADVAQGDYKHLAGAKAIMLHDDYTPSIQFSIGVASNAGG